MKLITTVLGYLARLVFSLLLILIPVVIRLLLYTLRLEIATMASIQIGVPKTVEIIADDWLQKAIQLGFPVQWEKFLYQVFLVLASAMIGVGWIVLFFTTVWMIHLIF